MNIAPRYPLEFPVTLAAAPGAISPAMLDPMTQEASAISADLSRTGLGLTFLLPVSFVPGEVVDITIHVEREPLAFSESESVTTERLTIKGRVVWSKVGRCGIEIVDMTGSGREFYENLLSGYQTLNDLVAVC